MSDSPVTAPPVADPRITKKRVTMTSVVFAGKDENGVDTYHKHEAIDYVREDFLDAYVEAARKAWQNVQVSAEYDAGPGGYDGPTYIPEALDHPDAGKLFAATPGSAIEAELAANEITAPSEEVVFVSTAEPADAEGV